MRCCTHNFTEGLPKSIGEYNTFNKVPNHVQTQTLNTLERENNSCLYNLETLTTKLNLNVNKLLGLSENK